MRDYTGISDEELIIMLRDGENEIMEYLLDKYKNLVRKKAASFFLLGGDDQDLIQEGMIGLFKAIRDYDPGRDASFFTFAELCISRNIYSAVQKFGRKKHSPLNGYVSLSYGGESGDKFGSDEEKVSIEAIEGLLPGNMGLNPEELFISREKVSMIEKFIDEELSSLEKQVLELHVTGMNYTEIAKVLERDEKSTDNALFRIKKKIRTYIEENM